MDFNAIVTSHAAGQRKADPVEQAIKAFNENPDRPFDTIDGKKVFHHARRPILATDCDYEVISFSGVQGRRLSA